LPRFANDSEPEAKDFGDHGILGMICASQEMILTKSDIGVQHPGKKLDIRPDLGQGKPTLRGDREFEKGNPKSCRIETN
jgi:hypothetical protein